MRSRRQKKILLGLNNQVTQASGTVALCTPGMDGELALE